MIKKVVIVGALASLLLMACSSQSTDESKSSNIDTSTAPEQGATATEESSAVTEANTAQAVVLTEENVNELEKQVAAIEEKATSYTAGGTAAENKAAYFAIDQEIELIEEQIDQFDDGIEADYYAGAITQVEYQEKEFQLEQLENRLDAAEATLQLKSGIED